MFKIKRGLNLPITGNPEQIIQLSPKFKTIGLTGSDYLGMKPTMKVQVGDVVSPGNILFEDKKNPGVVFPSPVSGKVKEINRGDKRALLTVVIEVDPKASNTPQFEKFSREALERVEPSKLEEHLVATGQWLHLRTRPYSRTPARGSRPSAVFVTAMDTNPLAADVAVVMKGNEEEFKIGCTALARLAPKVYVSSAPATQIPHGYAKNIVSKEFSGPHPAGLAGTHIHFIDPVSKEKIAWWINYQDVIALGRTLLTGIIDHHRVVAVAGPMMNDPCLMRIPMGAPIQEVVAGRLLGDDCRVISGSVFNGRQVTKELGYLGHFHHQIIALKEGRERVLLGWKRPGFDKFSVANIFASRLIPGKTFSFTTSTEGSMRTMVPVGSYEKVMPLDIEPTFLLRSLLTGDTVEAQRLGALELDEEDVALCTFVCATKEEYGPLLRSCLTKIERDG